jgi:hypothetical protein
MIGMKLVGMLIGRKAKEKVADVVLDKVDLPDPVENVIKAAITGNPTDLLGNMGKDMAKEAVLDALTSKAPAKRVRKK